MNTLIFLRHAEVEIDKNKPISEWPLSDYGKRHAETVANSGIFDDVDVIISSAERKAYQTAEPIARRIGKNIIQYKELNKLDRDKDR
ncbi:MAG: histidine phosphatase family protein [Candidatus Diapherotrites archaeon]|nr:histidine phosphatase family protein [Candidatus Diapherotrites archaeon]